MYISDRVLNATQFITVFVVSTEVASRLSGGIDRIGIIFGIYVLLLFMACAYEITIKPGRKRGYPAGKIAAEVMLVWVLPLLMGLATGRACGMRPGAPDCP